MINHIEIPQCYYELCANWHSGQSDLLYAVASSGGLTTGKIRPLGCDTDEKWYLQLWREFSGDVGAAARSAEKCNNREHSKYDDDKALRDFECWIDCIVIPQLESDYGLADWENS